MVLTSADVSHVLQQQQLSGYQYQNPAPQNYVQSSYGVPQSSVLGNTDQSVSYSSSGSASAPQLSLPSISGPSIGFSSGISPSSSGISIQSYNGFPSSVSNAGLSGFQVSTPSPNVDLSNIQVSTPSPSVDLSSFQGFSSTPSVDLSGFQGSTPSPSVDLSSFQVSSPSSNIDLSSFQGFSSTPSVGLSGFQVSTPSSIPSVNLVSYSQTPNSYEFLSKLGQPSIGVPSSASSYSSGPKTFSGNMGAGGYSSGQTSGGDINDAFGVVTDSAGSVGYNKEAEVSKQLYFFAAPEDEEEEVNAKIDLPPPPPKKTYKIIFIKAPTYRNQATINIPAPPQNEEKTLVYVLVKKPEGQPKVRFQDAAPTQPSKPEVFFIKYKTQKEAEAAVADIQSKHGASGHVISNLPAGLQRAGDVSGAGAIAPGSLTGLPLDSLGANTIVSSTPVSINSASSGDETVSITSQEQESAPIHIGDSISVSTVPSSLNFGNQNGFGSGPSFPSVSSLNSLGGNSFIASTPASTNFENRNSEETEDPLVSIGPQEQESISAQGENNETPVNSAQSLQGIASGSIAPSESGSLESNSAIGLSTQDQQPTSGISGSEGDVAATADVSGSAPGGSENNHISQNVIEQQATGSADNAVQGSQSIGFSTYGPPKY